MRRGGAPHRYGRLMSPPSAPSAPSASRSSPSPPPPTATAEQVRALREDLVSSGWGVEAVADLLGEAAAAALHREIRLPALRAVRAALVESRDAGTAPSPVAVLTALFMLGQTVSVAKR